MRIQPGDVLQQRYEIGERLGSGSFVRTHAATRLSDQRAVVIKELGFAALDSWKPYELFQREAQVLASLNHPAIPGLIEAFDVTEADEARFYLVIEQVPGQSLARKLSMGWRPQASEVRQIALNLLGVLEYLHSLSPSVLHRDLKPSNILLEGQNVYLVDFGAVQEAIHPEGGSTIVGTYGYMAPEQLLGRASAASDLYALGATLVHLLAGKAPSELPQRELRLLFREAVTADSGFCDWLERLLEPMPERRFRRASEARHALLSPAQRLDLPRPMPAPAQTRAMLKRSSEGLNLLIPPGDFNVVTIFQNFATALLVCSLPFIHLMTATRLGFWGLLITLPALLLAWKLTKQTAMALFSSRNLLITPEQVIYRRYISHLYEEGQKSSLNALQIYTSDAQPASQRQALDALGLMTPGGPQMLTAGLSPAEQLWLDSELMAYLAEVLPEHDFRRLSAGESEQTS